MLSTAAPALAFLAGVLSILSPCVLPLVPIVMGSAQAQHRWGPVALGGGLAVSFTAVGMFVATIGFSIGLDADLFRRIGGAMLLAFGLVLLTPALQLRLAAAAAPIGAWAGGSADHLDRRGLWGQAALGGLLGLVWAPCVGPTLGAASLLAAQGESLGQVTVVMGAFALGAAAPLVVIGLLSAEGLKRWRSRMQSAGSGGKRLLGAVLVLIGVLMLSGLDRPIETFLVDVSPAWLTRLTTSI